MQRIDVLSSNMQQINPTKWKRHLLGTRQLKGQAYEDLKATRTLPDGVGENVTCHISGEF